MTVTPAVGTTVYEVLNDLEVEIVRVFDAPRHLLFDAFTKPELITKWMLGPPGWSMPVCETDVRPGGKWHYVWRKDDGSDMEMFGSFLDVEPPARLVTTEAWGPPFPETVNTVTFEEDQGRTTVTMTIRYESKDARDAALATGMKDGSDVSYNRLDELLATLT